jgi:hypothetical protein
MGRLRLAVKDAEGIEGSRGDARDTARVLIALADAQIKNGTGTSV